MTPILNRVLPRHLALCLVVLISVLITGCAQITAKEKTSQSISNQQPEYWPTKKWRTATPEKQGMSSELLVQMLKVINDRNIAINGVLVVRNGYIVAEANKRSPDYIYPMYSSTKSITSALVGIALEQGYIRSIDQKVLDFFSEYSIGTNQAGKSSITLKHLLTMSSGIEWPETDTKYDYSDPRNPINQMIISRDWIRFILNKPLAFDPGTVFNYNSGCSHLLMGVLYRQGLNVETFAHKFLFSRLGISPSQYVWTKDQKGNLAGSHGLTMTLHDQAKIGYLYLKEGRWEGSEIIPKAWIKESTKEHIGTSGGLAFLAYGYGYQWYIQPFGFHSLGHRGQYIFVLPKHDLVVVFASNLNGPQIGIPITLLDKYIIPAVQKSRQLPENGPATTRLRSEIEKFEKQP